MKTKLILFGLYCTVFLLFPFFGKSQFTHKIKADSVRIYNDNCTAELIVENSTSNIRGFLFNKGAGRTEFRKAVIRLNDSSFQIGGDTLTIKPVFNGLQAGSVLFYDGTSINQDNNQFFWDNINKRLGVGTKTPLGVFEAVGVSYFTRTGQSLLLNPNYSGANTHAQLQVIGDMGLAFATNGDNERGRITSSGRWLFGTTTDNLTDRIQVNGTAYFFGAQPYIALYDNTWGAGSLIRSGVNTIGTAVGDYQLFNVPTGKGFSFSQNYTTSLFNISPGGAGTFINTLQASTTIGGTSLILTNTGVQNANRMELRGGTAATSVNWAIEKDNTLSNSLQITPSTLSGGTTYSNPVLSLVASDRIATLHGPGGGANSLLRYADGANAKFSTGFNNSNYIVYDDVNSAYRLTIDDTNGFVSISERGGTTPTYRGNLIINQGSSTISSNGGIEIFADGAGNGYGWRTQAVFDGSSAYNYSIQSRSNSTSWNERVAIASTGAATFTNTVKAPIFSISGQDFAYRELLWTTNGSLRWDMYVIGAEPGSNGGSNMYLSRYDDAGAYLGNIFSINRSNGILDFAVAPRFNNTPIVYNSGTWNINTTGNAATATTATNATYWGGGSSGPYTFTYTTTPSINSYMMALSPTGDWRPATASVVQTFIGLNTSNWVDILSNQTISGTKVFSNPITVYNRVNIIGSLSGGLTLGQWDGTYNRIEGNADRDLFIVTYGSLLRMGVNGSTHYSINASGENTWSSSGTFGSYINQNTSSPVWGGGFLNNAINLLAGSIASVNGTDFRLFTNLYYDGAAYKLRNAGYGSFITFDGGEMSYYTTEYGTAGTVPSLSNVFVVSRTGDVTITSTMYNSKRNNITLTGAIPTDKANGFHLLSPSAYWGIRTNSSNEFRLDVYNQGSPITALTIGQSAAATFRSSVTASSFYSSNLTSIVNNVTGTFKALAISNTWAGIGNNTAIYMGYNANGSDAYGTRIVQTGYAYSTRRGGFKLQSHNDAVGDTDNEYYDLLSLSSSGNAVLRNNISLSSGVERGYYYSGNDNAGINLGNKADIFALNNGSFYLGSNLLYDQGWYRASYSGYGLMIEMSSSNGQFAIYSASNGTANSAATLTNIFSITRDGDVVATSFSGSGSGLTGVASSLTAGAVSYLGGYANNISTSIQSATIQSVIAQDVNNNIYRYNATALQTFLSLNTAAYVQANQNLNTSSNVTFTTIDGSLIRSTGDVIAYYSSDPRFKSNMVKISNATQILEKLSGYSFEWNSKQTVYKEGTKDLGLNAEEVYELFKEYSGVVTIREDGSKAIMYHKLIPILVESNKELNNRLKLLEDAIKRLQK